MQSSSSESCDLDAMTALLAQEPFDEIVEPLSRSFDESGMTEEELDELIERERQAIWEERYG